jgi:hypothetical protein
MLSLTLVAKPQPRKQPTALELAFASLWAEVASGSPRLRVLEAEVVLPPRKFRFDYLVPGTNVLIEVQGGTWSRQRLGHSTGAGLHRDYEKARYAQMRGYLCLCYDRKQINRSELGVLYEYICRTYPDLA